MVWIAPPSAALRLGLPRLASLALPSVFVGSDVLWKGWADDSGER